MTARLDPPTSGDATAHLHLEIGPVEGPGDRTETIQLVTTETDVPRLPITVLAWAQSGPVVRPSELFLRDVGAAAKGAKLGTLQVFTRSGALQLLGVDTGTPAVAAEVSPRTPGKFYDVVLRYQGGWKPGSMDGVLRVRVGDARHQVLTVPYHLVVR